MKAFYKTISTLLFLTLVIVFTSCKDRVIDTYKFVGNKPVYMSYEDMRAGVKTIDGIELKNTGIRDNRETQPAKLDLLRNYPNPFNPSTRICFEVSKSGHIILKMFNILGDEIDTLINAYKSVGVYEVNFRATHLPSGIYLCKMVSGNEIKTHKILLAR